MEFLTILFIILCIYVAIRLVFKYYGRHIMQWLGKKAMQQMGKRMQKSGAFDPFDTSSQAQKAPANSSQDRKKQQKKVVGEYIDFEEID